MYRPKRRLTDYVEMHRRDRSMLTIFVEGPSDRAVLNRVLGGDLPQFARVDVIDDYEIDLEIDGLGGAKQRVRAACSYAVDSGVERILGVIDRNFDDVPEPTDRIVVTTFTDIEWHICELGDLARIVEDAFARVVTGPAIVSAINMSARLFDARSVGVKEGLPIGVPDSSSFVVIKHGQADIDLDALLEAMDSKNRTGNAWRKLKAQVIAAMDAGRTKEPKSHMGFHTTEELLSYCLRHMLSFPGNGFAKDWLGRLIRVRISAEICAKDQFFISVLVRAQRAANLG